MNAFPSSRRTFLGEAATSGWRLHRAIARREIDVVMAWSVDRLGRSLQD